MTRFHFESVSRYYDNIKSSKDALSLASYLYESAVLQLSKQEAILSAHSMYKVGKTVFHSAV